MFTATIIPQSVRTAQPFSVYAGGYSVDMASRPPQNVLWANICARFGVDPWAPGALDRVLPKAGVGRGTLQRIQAGEDGTRLSSLITIAERLGIPVWRLLQPEDDRDQSPPEWTPVVRSIAARAARLSRDDQTRLDAMLQTLAASGSGVAELLDLLTGSHVSPTRSPTPSHESPSSAGPGGPQLQAQRATRPRAARARR